MTCTCTTNRPGLAAIAAVLALSSTRLAAQAAPAEQPVAEAPADTAVDPLAPTPEVEAAAPAVESPDASADPLAPVLTEETGADDETPSEESAEVADIAKPVATKSITRSQHAGKTIAAPTIAQIAQPVGDPPTAPETVRPTVETATIPDARPVEKSIFDDALPVAGGAGALFLALAGAGIAVRRRRRRREEEQFDLWEDETTSAEDGRADPGPLWDRPMVEPNPAPAATATAATAATEVPDGFDTSSLGRHVLAAYRGPTPENPSTSLRDRLAIAAELDRREREPHETRSAPSPTKPVTARPAPKIQSLSFSFSGTPTQLKWPQSRV